MFRTNFTLYQTFNRAQPSVVPGRLPGGGGASYLGGQPGPQGVATKGGWPQGVFVNYNNTNTQFAVSIVCSGFIWRFLRENKYLKSPPVHITMYQSQIAVLEASYRFVQRIAIKKMSL